MKLTQTEQQLLLSTHSLSALSTRCTIPWTLPFPQTNSTTPSSPPATPLAVLTTWLSANQLTSESAARLHFFPVCSAAGTEFILDLLRLEQYGAEEREGILETEVVVRRKVNKEGASLSLRKWTAEKCLRKLGSLDVRFWAQYEGGGETLQVVGDDELQQDLGHVYLEGREGNARRTKTPGRFDEFDDFDWGESDESVDEEDISRDGDVRDQDQEQILSGRRTSFSHHANASILDAAQDDDDNKIDCDAISDIVQREPVLTRWVLELQAASRAQKEALSHLKEQTSTQTAEVSRLNLLVQERDAELRLVRAGLAKQTAALNHGADALANMSAEYDKTQLLSNDMLMLTLANRSRDRDDEENVRELIDQLKRVSQTVDELREANKGLKRVNKTQAAALDAQNADADTDPDTDLELGHVQLANLQTQQQQLLDLSLEVSDRARIVTHAAGTWWDEVWGKGTKVLDAIVKLQGHYNNPFSATFAATFAGGGQFQTHEAADASDSTHDLQKREMENLVQATRGETFFPPFVVPCHVFLIVSSLFSCCVCYSSSSI